ncbi:hypothetical protein [Adhaeribacter aquaticus]|uniref:hypothetical protein n=1 Tax=Adhaeribacter aquaticus TaxID=299567 RepID=UPI0004186A2D|nr:hypothetical protein [Adhaeribacter aquaticus]
MKFRLFTHLFFALIIALAAASCRTSPIARYPNPYPSPGGHSRGLPPGQAKKVYGHQSARAFAPGQQKKHGHYHGNGKGKGKRK